MEGNQSLAKIGVFVLLGLNVGAYYFFWPRNQDASKMPANAAASANGATKLLPMPTSGTVEEQEPTPFPLSIPGQPKIPPPPVVLQTEPLIRPAPVVAALPVSTPRTVERRAAPDDDKTIRNLLNEIEDKSPKNPAESLEPIQQVKELSHLPLAQNIDGKVAPLKIGSVYPPKLELFQMPDAKEVGIAPPMPPEKAPPAIALPLEPRKDVAVASPLAPKTPPVRWVYHTDKAGARTQVTARLRDLGSERVLVEFRVLCDCVDAQNAVVKAVGNVTFVGAGWKGTCQSLTLTANETRLVFEDRVEILQDILNPSQESVVRGDRIVWDLPTPAAPPTPTSTPTTGVTQPLPVRTGLGGPN